MGRLRSPLLFLAGEFDRWRIYMSSRSLLLALRVPGRSFRGGKMFRVLILFVSLAFCSSVFAGNPYTWEVVMYSSSGASTPAEACEKARVVADKSPDWNYTSATPKMNGLDNSYCSVVYVYRRDPSIVNTCDNCASWKLVRKGEQCANADDKYNESTGVCETPPKECEAGQTDLFASAPSPVVQISGRDQVLSTPPTGCRGGCAYTA